MKEKPWEDMSDQEKIEHLRSILMSHRHIEKRFGFGPEEVVFTRPTDKDGKIIQ